MMQFPTPLQQLVTQLKRLPGVGDRTAERYAFSLLEWEQSDLLSLGQLVNEIKNKLPICNDCGCFLHESSCRFCSSPRRNRERLCVLASPKDAYVMEATGEYDGLYHVLGGVMSPMRDRGPESLRIQPLIQRLEALSTKEVILALDSTLEGDATSLYIKQLLEGLDIEVSRLAFGLPIGSSLDYVDGGTLARAFSGRRAF